MTVPITGWVVIPDYPKYEAHPLGLVRRIDSQHPLAATTGKLDWPAVAIYYGKPSKRVCTTVANLICKTFNGPAPSPLHRALHCNGNSLDNRADNLKWVVQGVWKERSVRAPTKAQLREEIEELRRIGDRMAAVCITLPVVCKLAKEWKQIKSNFGETSL